MNHCSKNKNLSWELLLLRLLISFDLRHSIAVKIFVSLGKSFCYVYIFEDSSIRFQSIDWCFQSWSSIFAFVMVFLHESSFLEFRFYHFFKVI